jgi:uncharacterized caspase-like protein
MRTLLGRKSAAKSSVTSFLKLIVLAAVLFFAAPTFAADRVALVIGNGIYQKVPTPTEPTDNVLVAYAARDGTTATDGDGRNSPFTTALLRNTETPGLEISFLFRNVRDEVMSATKREHNHLSMARFPRKRSI